MKVSKNVSIDIELLNKVRAKENKFSKAVSEALDLWINIDPKLMREILSAGHGETTKNQQMASDTRST